MCTLQDVQVRLKTLPQSTGSCACTPVKMVGVSKPVWLPERRHVAFQDQVQACWECEPHAHLQCSIYMLPSGQDCMWSTVQLCNTFSTSDYCSNRTVAYDFVVVSKIYRALPNVTCSLVYEPCFWVLCSHCRYCDGRFMLSNSAVHVHCASTYLIRPVQMRCC